jgi:MSHA biogenesis protein MshJ
MKLVLPAKITHYLDRVDAMTLRERVMIFAAAVVVLVTLINGLLIDPLLKRQQGALKALDQHQAQIAAIQMQISTLANSRSTASTAITAKTADLRELNSRLESLEKRVAESEQTLVQPERVNALLAEIVKRNRGIQLQSLKNLPVTDVSGNSLFRHGVEIKVSGRFMDLLAYLSDLEKLPFKASWGALEMDASAFPQISLVVTVTTLSTARPWMQI